jgi:hypothetical protein
MQISERRELALGREGIENRPKNSSLEILREDSPRQAADKCIELRDLSMVAQCFEFRCVGLNDIGHRESLFQMGYKLRVDLDGKESGAMVASIQDGLGKRSRSGSDFGDSRASFPIDSVEHFSGQISRTRCNGTNGRRVIDKPIEKFDPIRLWQG